MHLSWMFYNIATVFCLIYGNDNMHLVDFIENLTKIPFKFFFLMKLVIIKNFANKLIKLIN